MMMMATGLLMTSSLFSLTRSSGYELEIVDSFQPTAGNIIGTIAIGEEMHYEMDVTIHSIPTNWGAVFNCGTYDCVEGARLPAIFLHKRSGTDGADAEGFHTCWSHDDNGNNCVQTDHLTVGQTYHLEIDITESLYTVTQDGVVQYSGSKAAHTTYDSATCYASCGGGWDAGDVTLSNIRVWAGAEPTTTEEPTKAPSAAPTEPTKRPSAEPTNDPTRDCSVFHIDEFLMDCSVEFDDHDTNIKALQDEVSTLQEEMSSLKDTVAQLVTDTATDSDSIDKINDELELVTEALDRMGDWP